MKITGIICEYNPLHLGHKKQLDIIRATNPDGGIVCLMSGNFVQRGAPAIIDKSLRAKAAILCGADLVLELPVNACLSSAEGFARAAVRILSPFCNNLCFGAETPDKEILNRTAEALLSPEFSTHLRQYLDLGISFPAAREKALLQMGLQDSPITQPNDILAVEYCKAILQLKSDMQPMPILRQGDYHDTDCDSSNPSATAIRSLMLQNKPWDDYVPTEAAECFAGAALHSLEFGELAILGKLRTMTDEQFASLPFGSEGLWRKLMHAARREATLQDIVSSVKSKRYTRTRIDRMIMCAFLGLTENDLKTPAPYVRVLALNDCGREILKAARQSGCFPNAGELQDSDHQLLETRCGNLYGLFAENSPEAPGTAAAERVFYFKN